MHAVWASLTTFRPLEPHSTDEMGMFAVSYEIWPLKSNQHRVAWVIDRLSLPALQRKGSDSGRDSHLFSPQTGLRLGSQLGLTGGKKELTTPSPEDDAVFRNDDLERHHPTISGDGLSFAVGTRIWKVKPHCPEGVISLRVWPEPIVFESVDIPLMKIGPSQSIVQAAIEFMPLSHYVLATTSIRTEGHVEGISIIQAYQLRDSKPFRVKKLYSKRLPSYNKSLVNLIYHPRLPICAIHEKRERTLVTLWNFDTGMSI